MNLFVDRIEIKVCGGDGGRGAISFRREKFVPRGGPDGGDGGDGGNVVLEATVDEQSLVAFRFLNHYEAPNGEQGMGKSRHGKRGEDLVVRVPVGTIVRDRDEGHLLADLDEDGQRFVAAQGGRGGRGNARFVTSVQRAPRQAEPGAEGEERWLDLELKLIADAGLVGYPNAGKSTLLGAVSNADPATAAYPFTTLNPQVGVVEFDDFARLTIADIPGLIEGAHDNVGLGHDFLRHIERTTVLVYVLDTAGIDGRSPVDDLTALQHELECYQPGITGRPSLIVANKMDEAAAEENLPALRAATKLPIFPTCAVLGEGLPEFLAALRKLVKPTAK